MKSREVSIPPCSSDCCDFWLIGHTVLCIPGTVCDCIRAEFAEAEVSEFHTAELAAANAALKNILAGIDKRGRNLAFLRTPDGLLLAFVEPGAVSSRSDKAKVRQALKLKSIANK